MKEVKIAIGKEPYTLYMEKGLTNHLNSLLNLYTKNRPVFFIVDENVFNYYSKKIIDPFKNSIDKLNYFIIPSGEKNKSISIYEKIIGKLIDYKYNRDSVLISIGGGVVGDIAAFVASTYMRGIDIIHMPTTLLAQVDSSIGGKTGINYKGLKNLIGTFYHPKAVLIDTNILNTLPDREYTAAYGEIIKYGMLSDYKILVDLEKNHKGHINKSINLDDIILKCIKIKEEIVVKDETDFGIRRTLNLGHTFAHGIESTTRFNEFFHGEAVALGLFLASKLSFNLNLITEDYYKFIYNLIQKYFNNIFQVPLDIKQILKSMSMDKKNKDDSITFILPVGKEQVKVCNNIPMEIINKVIVEAKYEFGYK